MYKFDYTRKYDSSIHLELLTKIAVKLLDEKFGNDIAKPKTKKEIANIVNIAL